jgi:hypothetical protein
MILGPTASHVAGISGMTPWHVVWDGVCVCLAWDPHLPYLHSTSSWICRCEPLCLVKNVMFLRGVQQVLSISVYIVPKRPLLRKICECSECMEFSAN